MGVDLSRSTPSSNSNVLDRIFNESSVLGSGFGQGLSGLLADIGGALAYLFRPRDVYVPPPLEYMSPIVADAEAAVRAWTDKTDLALERAESYRVAAEEATGDLAQAIDPEHPDSHIFKLIVAVEEAQNATMALHEEAIKANRNAIDALLEYVQRTLFIPADAAVSNDHWTVSRSGNDVTLTALPGWVGTAVLHYSSGAYVSVEGKRVPVTHPIFEAFPVPGPNNDRTITVSSSSEILYGANTRNDPAPVVVQYTINPGTARVVPIQNATVQTLPSGEWTTIAEWQVPEDTNAVADAKFIWAYKTWAGTYRARLTLDGVDITSGVATSSAPLLGHGPRAHQVSIRQQAMSSGQTLRLEAYAAHGNSLNRQVRDVELNVTYIQRTSS